MSTADKPRALLAIEYAEYAEAYLRSLPLEHFMEATAQGTQRKITLESLDLVHARRPEVQIFNELLVQYPRPRERKPHQVVPDNMVVVWKEPIKASGSYDVPLQPIGPFWVLEYVSKYNKRKDYEASFQKYERELKVPYYLVFYPDNQELSLYHLKGRRYVSVLPNDHGRCSIPDLDLEVGLQDGWVRYWYRGELLPLPADLQRSLEETRRQLQEEKQRTKQQKRRADREKARADQEEQRAEQEKQRADQEQQTREALQQELQALRAQLQRTEARPSDRP